MFVLDPKKRPSADECLKHTFFSLKIKDETRNQSQYNFEREYFEARNQSKSTEKTDGSFSTESIANNRMKY